MSNLPPIHVHIHRDVVYSTPGHYVIEHPDAQSGLSPEMVRTVFELLTRAIESRVAMGAPEHAPEFTAPKPPETAAASKVTAASVVDFNHVCADTARQFFAEPIRGKLVIVLGYVCAPVTAVDYDGDTADIVIGWADGSVRVKADVLDLVKIVCDPPGAPADYPADTSYIQLVWHPSVALDITPGEPDYTAYVLQKRALEGGPYTFVGAP